MEPTEENHVPILRQLLDGLGEPGIESWIEHSVVFKDQNAGPSFVAGLLDHRQVAAQTTVRAREKIPRRGELKTLTVQRGKSSDLFDIVLCKSRQHLLPAIASLIQVYANLIWEEVVKIHRQSSFLTYTRNVFRRATNFVA
jgi:hypothetical protein